MKADIQVGYRVADLYLAKFFDVARRIGDKRLLALIGRCLRANTASEN